MRMRIYVASSWRNPYQASLVAELRKEGYLVYDFKNPPDNSTFGWDEIDPNYTLWTPEQYAMALNTDVATRAFQADMDALEACDMCILVWPSGRDAHLEAGWAACEGKPTALYYPQESAPDDPSLMVKMLTTVLTSLPQVVAFCRGIDTSRPGRGDSANLDRRFAPGKSE